MSTATVHHTCGDPACLTVDHLEPVWACPHRSCHAEFPTPIRWEAHAALAHDAYVPLRGPVTDPGRCADHGCFCG